MKENVYKSDSFFSKFKKEILHVFRVLFHEFNRNSYYQYRVFKIFLYTWIVINTLILIPGREYFWGKYSFIPEMSIQQLSFLKALMHLLYIPWLSDFYSIFIGIQILFSVLAIFNVWPRLSAFVVFIVTLNLDNKIHVTMDGGNNLIHLLLFYSVLIGGEKGIQSNSLMQFFSFYLSKASFIMARIQVTLVYFVAGHVKLSGNLWTNGTALYYTFNVDEYTHPWIQSFINQFSFVSVFGSYATLIFQLTFPFFIWFPRTRFLFILIGTFFHLGIAFGMGLVSFGFAMIVSYSLFYTREMAKNQYLDLSFKNSLLVGIDENCKMCNAFKNFVSFFDYFKNIKFDKARKPEHQLLLNIEEKERINEIYVYDYGRALYFKGMKGIEVIVKNTLLKPFYPFLSLLNVLGIGKPLYECFSNGLLRKKCSEKDCTF